MSVSSDPNINPPTGSEYFRRLKNVLKAAGWTVIASCDGVSAAASDLWGTTGSNDVALAWWIGQSPSGERQICIQRGTTETNWRVKYIKGAFAAYDNGNPTITPARASGLAEFVLCGGGTDASPTFDQLFYAGGGDNGSYPYRGQVVAINTTDGFWAGVFRVGSSTPEFQFLIDPLTGLQDPADADPVAFDMKGTWLAYRNSPWDGTSETYDLGPIGYYAGGLNTYQRMPMSYYGNRYSVCVGDNNAPVNTNTGGYDTFPVLYARPTNLGGPFGAKGYSTLFRWLWNGAVTRGDMVPLDGVAKSHVALSPYNRYPYVAVWDGTSDWLV